MKRISLILLFVFSNLLLFSQYYWYQGKQIPITEGSKRYVLFIAQENGQSGQFKQIGETPIPSIKWGIQESDSPMPSGVIYSSPSYKVAHDSIDVYITERFYVKLKHSNDDSLLQKYALDNNVEIVQVASVHLWYILSCTEQTKGNSLQIANLFYESGLFAAAQPEFINAYRVTCTNDMYFNEQWNLKNTGQHVPAYSGIDINYCEAHAITTGNSSVIIAVFDQGVELTHEDLNVYSISYNTETASSPSVVLGDHGTACAGIIGAQANNDIGVAGIAPDCPIMSISNSLSFLTNSNKIADGFMFAATHGASVISNSWYSMVCDNLITDAINYALTQGREGKGCVVVFASGNDDSSVNYPANSIDDIIVVGAVSPCAMRKQPFYCDETYMWGSNYGAELDIMAPGEYIPTTDLTGSAGYSGAYPPYNYTMDFNGTSAACPQVAAVAGLILSENPYLTQKEVADIIESTAQKVGGYNYTTHSGRPNGTWNNEMGYGLVDAYAAVQEAQNRLNAIQGPDYVCDTTKYYLKHALTSGSTINWSLSNAESAFFHYSLVGPTNQDTISVRCSYETILVSLTNEQTSIRSYIPTLTATITDGTYTETYRKKFRMPIGETPIFSASSSFIWLAGTPRTFTITNCANVPDSALTWTVKCIRYLTYGNHIGIPFVQTSTYTGRSITYIPPRFSSGTCDVTITAINTTQECITPDSQSYVVHGGLSLIANRESDKLNVMIQEENIDSQQTNEMLSTRSSSYTLELWHNIYGQQKTQVVNTTSEQMNIAGLPQGVYVLLLKENGEVVAQTKVQL